MVDPAHRELTERTYAAFNARDPETMVALCEPGVEFMSLVSEADGAVYRGHDGVRRFFAEQDEAFEDLHVELEELESHGDWVLMRGRIRAKGRMSGLDVDTRFVQLAHAPGGRILGWRFYRTREEALAALQSGDVLGLGRHGGSPPE